MDALTMPMRNSRVGACSLGDECTAQNQELTDEYRCRHCGKQLHGFISGCSIAKNPKDFRDGVICVNQPCAVIQPPPKGGERQDGVANAKAAGLPEFLWQTQQPKRKRDPNAPKQKRQRYSIEIKSAVLDRVNRDPTSRIPDIAKEFNIPEGTVRGWLDDYKRKPLPTGVAIAADDPPLSMGDIQESIMLGSTSADIAPQPATDRNDAKSEKEATNPGKRKRQRYSNETKIQVLLALESRKGQSLTTIAKEFNVAAGTVRGWRDEAANIHKAAMENRRGNAKANPSRDPLKRIWAAILSLFELNSKLPAGQRLEMNVNVVRTIGRQARDVLLEAHAKSPFLTANEVVNMEKFKASETWARKWSKDHQISNMGLKDDPNSNMSNMESHFEQLQTIVDDYPAKRVYTLTSMGIFYRILPNPSYVTQLTPHGKLVRACNGLKSKDHLTLYICSNESGTDKLPISCIGKYDHPACFRVPAQKKLPYFSQKQASSDPATIQKWWRTIFLPHIRKEHPDGSRCLLLIDPMETCKSNLLKDPTNQIRVESLPVFPPSSTSKSRKKTDSDEKGKESQVPSCQPLDFEILDHIKRRYRYRLLQEVMLAFGEREARRKVANDAHFAMGARGLREGSPPNICDSMDLLKDIWSELAESTILKGWQRSKLRSKTNVKEEDARIANAVTSETHPKPKKDRAKSEKRQTTKERKSVVRDLTIFLKENDLFTVAGEDRSGPELEDMMESLKSCFSQPNGKGIEDSKLLESLEDWIGLESSEGITMLHLEEAKEEMNIEYLVGLRQLTEGTIEEAEVGEDPELDSYLVRRNMKAEDEEDDRKLDLSAAVELATSIKATACKLFEHGNILGDLAVQLNDASNSIFDLLRKQKEDALAKEMAEKAKLKAKENAASRKAKKATDDNESREVIEVDEASDVAPLSVSI